MTTGEKATRLDLFNLKAVSTRAFHMSWFAFFLCFFAWFGIAPLMAIVREDLGLSKEQIGNTIIASVAVTIIARLIIGWLCDRYGPRRCYAWLLIVCSLPVMGIGLAKSYESFLLIRLAIGAIGASFVITQYHTSVMFAPNVVGTANATSAGWGNLGGGVTQIIMPLWFSLILLVVADKYLAWRLAMIVPGLIIAATGVAYYFFTQDTPKGNFEDLRDQQLSARSTARKGTFLEACRDHRVWVLFLIYGACFGVELTMSNIAALYFMDYFAMTLKMAGLVAGLFGLMNLFARTLGGVVGDYAGRRWGLSGRVQWLMLALGAEGLALMVFSQMRLLPMAIVMLMVFSLFVQMSEGATFSVVPFINRRCLGSVSGIVGAGGNVGAVAAGFLFRSESLSWFTALLIMGVLVTLCSGLALLIRFSTEEERLAGESQVAVLEAEMPPPQATPALLKVGE